MVEIVGLARDLDREEVRGSERARETAGAFVQPGRAVAAAAGTKTRTAHAARNVRRLAKLWTLLDSRRRSDEKKCAMDPKKRKRTPKKKSKVPGEWTRETDFT